MMRVMLAAAAAVAVATPALAGAFDGTWKADMSTYKAYSQPVTRLLAGGRFHCTCSTPPEDFAVDGAFHPTPGQTGYDEAMGSVIDANSVRFAFQLKGQPVLQTTETVSADGATLHMAWTDTSLPKTVTGEWQATRLGPAPAGAHAISGLWRASDKLSVSDAGLSATMAQTGDTLNVKSSDGSGYSAVIGGPFVPVEGGPAGMKVAVTMPDPRTLTATFQQDGKVYERSVWTLSADGKTTHGVFTDVASGHVESLTSVKQ